jgi:O-antigen/teichoic acid export membrane protein
MLYETVFESNANVLMRIVVPRAVREVGVRVGLLVSYLLYAFRYLSMDGFVVALCVTYAAASLINIFYVCRIGHIRFRPDWSFLRTNQPLVGSYIRYMSFLVLSALASVFAPMLSSFFVTAKMGLSFTGIFAIATYMAVMVSIPYRSLTAIASPQLAAALKEQNFTDAQRLMQQVTNSMLLVGSLIFLLLWVNIDLIFYVLPNGETYAAARQTVFLLGLAQLILASVQVSVTALSYGAYYGFTLLFSLVLTLTAVLLNNYLIPLYGMEGSAWSNLLSYVVYCVLVLAVVCGKMRLSPFCRTELKTLGLAVGVLVINYLWVRYMPMENVWLSSLLRSFVLIGGFCLIAYKSQLSEEINALLRSLFIRRH